tara:strand:+ start:173 stop:793 length:621 start_codon:yes stop_codon:yes gene_type:complete
MLFYIIILIIVIIVCFYYKNNSFNKNAIIYKSNINSFFSDIKTKNILLMNNINFQNIVNQIDTNVSIFKNKIISNNLINEIKLNLNLEELNSNIIFKKYYSLTININKSELLTSKFEYNIINQIKGNTTFYLINPKHKKDILNKNNNEIKKYSYKIILNENDLLLIPNNWFYFFENDNKYILLHIDYDSYFTYFINYVKNKYIQYI